MDTWYKFLLTNPDILEKSIRLKTDFIFMYNSNSNADVKGAVILSKIHSKGAMIYFSPIAAKIAKEILIDFNAEPCEIPSVKDNEDGYWLSFYCGDRLFYKENFQLKPKKKLFV
jgi:hypothetical protein